MGPCSRESAGASSGNWNGDPLQRSEARAQSAFPASLVMRNIRFRRNLLDRLADHGQREILQFPEANAGLAHVEFLAGLLELLAKPSFNFLASVNAHQVHGHVVLLRGEAGVAERLAVIGVGVAFERNL